MSTRLGRVLVTLTLSMAGLVVPVGASAAHASACQAYPFGRSSVPVFAEPSTDSPQVGTLTSSGATSPCTPETGAVYDMCGGGTQWVRVHRGFVPDACVDIIW